MDKINNINFTAKTQKPKETDKTKGLTMDETISQSMQKLIARAEREVPEYGNFKTVSEKFQNTDKSIIIGDVELNILSSDDKEEPCSRYFETKVFTKSGHSNSSVLLMYGENKKEFLKKLSAPELLEEIKETIIKQSQSLEDNDYL
jgi:hypothetical protein